MMTSGRHSMDSTPICRCRVLYLGSAVPQATKDGLQGIQEPLRELYPEQGALGARGIDSWLSVWSNGILLENVDENHKKVTRFFPIESLHYCAAVRYVLVPEKSQVTPSTLPRFLPLDSPFARSPNPNHPPLFACILRRTTGIKVLECHTFICKREMAANALVRCCFHAYADSAYAKHIDNNNSNSVYGTLRHDNSSGSIEKVDVWRNMPSTAGPSGGSTFTLDSAVNSTQNHTSTLNVENSNSADDLSIYNGDVNHKIWAGSQRDVNMGEENLYGECIGTLRSARSARPRQVVNATPPPPPPPKEEKSLKKVLKEKNRWKKNVNGNRDDMNSMMNGSLMRAGTWQRGVTNSQPSLGGYSSLNSTPYPAGGNGPMPPYPANGLGYGPPSNGTLMRANSQMMNGVPPIMIPMTLPHRPPKGFRPPPSMLAPLYIPTPQKHFPVTMEEPIYMPSARPMSPVSSYQPCHFPHEAYMMHHYATMDHNPKKKSKDKKHKKNPPMPLIITNGRQDGDEWSEVSLYQRKVKEDKNGKISSLSLNAERRSNESESPFNSEAYRKKGKNSKSKKPSSNGIDKEENEEDSDGSPFNTGIYKRKGHLNERAFSYSIRQEHRSRSYGSLANLKFAPVPVVPNGGGPPSGQYYAGSINKEEVKKEREIMQMMQDLDLSGDELERSEVPASVYQAKQRSSKIRR